MLKGPRGARYWTFAVLSLSLPYHYPPLPATVTPYPPHIILPELESNFVLRVNQREYGIPELVSFLSNYAFEEGFSSDQTFPPAGSSDPRHMFEGALYPKGLATG